MVILGASCCTLQVTAYRLGGSGVRAHFVIWPVYTSELVNKVRSDRKTFLLILHRGTPLRLVNYDAERCATLDFAALLSAPPHGSTSCREMSSTNNSVCG